MFVSVATITEQEQDIRQNQTNKSIDNKYFAWALSAIPNKNKFPDADNQQAGDLTGARSGTRTRTAAMARGF